MSTRIPSLFDDDFFFEEKSKKEENEMETSKGMNEEKEKQSSDTIKEKKDDELFRSEEKAEKGKIRDQSQAEEKSETEIIPNAETVEEQNVSIEGVEDIIPKNEKPFFSKKPQLELPKSEEDGEVTLDKQIFQEALQLDAVHLLRKKKPLKPISFEFIEEEKKEEKEVLLTDRKMNEADLGTVNINEENSEIEEFEREEEVVEELPKWILEKNYYTIGEVAKMFDVNISHIRFWTTEFKMNPRTTRKGDRLYTPKEIEQLRLIHYLVKVKKHTLKGAREKLKNQKKTVASNLDLKDSLLKLKSIMEELKNSLD